VQSALATAARIPAPACLPTGAPPPLDKPERMHPGPAWVAVGALRDNDGRCIFRIAE